MAQAARRTMICKAAQAAWCWPLALLAWACWANMAIRSCVKLLCSCSAWCPATKDARPAGVQEQTSAAADWKLGSAAGVLHWWNRTMSRAGSWV